MSKELELTDEQSREGILKIEKCETDVECPIDFDDPCVECRANQLLTLLSGRIEEARKEIKRELDNIIVEDIDSNGSKIVVGWADEYKDYWKDKWGVDNE